MASKGNQLSESGSSSEESIGLEELKKDMKREDFGDPEKIIKKTYEISNFPHLKEIAQMARPNMNRT